MMESGVSSTAIPNVVVTEIDAPVDALVSPSTPGSVHSESGDASPHGELPHDRGSPESHWTPANVADRLNAAQLRIRLLPRLQVTAIETQVARNESGLYEHETDGVFTEQQSQSAQLHGRVSRDNSGLCENETEADLVEQLQESAIMADPTLSGSVKAATISFIVADEAQSPNSDVILDKVDMLLTDPSAGLYPAVVDMLGLPQQTQSIVYAYPRSPDAFDHAKFDDAASLERGCIILFDEFDKCCGCAVLESKLSMPDDSFANVCDEQTCLAVLARDDVRRFVVPLWQALGSGRGFGLAGATSFYFRPKSKGFAIGTLHLLMKNNLQLQFVLRSTSTERLLKLSAGHVTTSLKYWNSAHHSSLLATDAAESQDESAKECATFVENFRFEGNDTTLATIVGPNGRAFAPDAKECLMSAQQVRIRLQGKCITISSKESSNLIAKFTLHRLPTASDFDMVKELREGRQSKLWGCVLMHNFIAPGSLRGTPYSRLKQLVVFFSEREFCSWKMALSVNLNVFEENKMSVFRPLPPAFKSEQKGSLGKGSFGSVSMHELDGVLYAVKEIDMSHLVESRSVYSYNLEIVKCYLEAQILIALRDSTLMQLRCLSFDVGEDERPGATEEWGPSGTVLLRRLYLVMDFAKGGDMKKYAFSQQKLPGLVLLRVWRELFTGLKYCHENHGLVHCDLKPENIVFVRELTTLSEKELRRRRNEGGPGTILRIVDFGVAVYGSTPSERTQKRRDDRQVTKDTSLTLDRWESRGTMAYCAPEMLQDHPSGMCKVFTTKADVWSAMLIVWESWTQKPWLEDKNLSNLRKAVLARTVPDMSTVPPFLEAIMRYGLQFNDRKRPEASEIFEYFHQEETAALEEIDEAERAENDAAGQGRRTHLELEDEKASQTVSTHLVSSLRQASIVRREMSERLTNSSMDDPSLQIPDVLRSVSDVMRTVSEGRSNSDTMGSSIGHGPVAEWMSNLIGGGRSVSPVGKTEPSQKKNVAIPFLFSSSVAEVTARLRRDSDELPAPQRFAHMVKGFLHVVMLSPCHLLPPAEHLHLMGCLVALLNEGKTYPPMRLDLDWTMYSTPIVQRLRSFVDFPNEERHEVEIEALTTVLAVLGECADSTSKNAFLDSFASLPTNFLSQLQRIVGSDRLCRLCGTWSRYMSIQALADFISISNVGSVLQKGSSTHLIKNCAALACAIGGEPTEPAAVPTQDSMASVASTDSARRLKRRVSYDTDVSFDATADDDDFVDDGESQEAAIARLWGCVEGDTHPASFSCDANIDEKISIMRGLLLQTARLMTQLCSLGSIDSCVYLRRIVDEESVFDSLLTGVRGLDDATAVGDRNVVVHLARILCVCPCASPRAMPMLCYWMISIPFDDNEFREPTKEMASIMPNKPVAKRLHKVISDAMLCQAGFQVLRDVHAILSIALLVIWEQFGRSVPSGTKHRCRALQQSFRNCDDYEEKMRDATMLASADFHPPSLWAFRDPVVGAEVLNDIVQCCHYTTRIPPHFRESIIWLATYLLLDGLKGIEMHCGSLMPVDTIDVDTQRSSFLRSPLSAFPRACLSLVPVLVDISEGMCDVLAPLSGFHNLKTYGREMLAHLVTHPFVHTLRPLYEIAQLTEFLVDELAGLYEDINSYNSNGQTVQATLENERLDSLDFAMKGLLMLTSTMCESSIRVITELSQDDTFLGVLAFIFICEETSAFECPPFLLEIAKFKGHALAFLNHPAILKALLKSGLVKVDSVFTAMLASTSASDNTGNILRPRCFLDNYGLNNWYSRWYRLGGPTYSNCVSMILFAMHQDDLKSKFILGLNVPPQNLREVKRRVRSHNRPIRTRSSASSVSSEHGLQPPAFRGPAVLLQAVSDFIEDFQPLADIAQHSALAICRLLQELWSFSDSGRQLSPDCHAYLDVVTGNAIVAICHPPSSELIKWDSRVRLEALAVLSDVIKMCIRSDCNFVVEIDIIRQLGTWMSMSNLWFLEWVRTAEGKRDFTAGPIGELRSRLTRNAVFIIQYHCQRMLAPNREALSASAQKRQDYRIKGRQMLPSQWPSRVCDFAEEKMAENTLVCSSLPVDSVLKAQLQDENNTIEVCVDQARAELANVGRREWPTSVPNLVIDEIRLAYERTLRSITKNSTLAAACVIYLYAGTDFQSLHKSLEKHCLHKTPTLQVLTFRGLPTSDEALHNLQVAGTEELHNVLLLCESLKHIVFDTVQFKDCDKATKWQISSTKSIGVATKILCALLQQDSDIEIALSNCTIDPCAARNIVKLMKDYPRLLQRKLLRLDDKSIGSAPTISEFLKK